MSLQIQIRKLEERIEKIENVVILMYKDFNNIKAAIEELRTQQTRR
jgi:prefoldin subunit 5|tara:strand:- start:830 stop:967 length:138 start_codon:yes stop_codon:yes gene_type:complete